MPIVNIITKIHLFKYIENFTTKKKKKKKKNENFQIKTSDTFHSSAQNIDSWYSLEPPQRGGSNEYPQSMFLSRNKKNNVYPCKPQFYYIKVGCKGSKVYRHVFVYYQHLMLSLAKYQDISDSQQAFCLNLCRAIIFRKKNPVRPITIRYRFKQNAYWALIDSRIYAKY